MHATTPSSLLAAAQSSLARAWGLPAYADASRPAATGGSWSMIANPTSSLGAPPARRDAQLAYDPADGYVVLFGGAGDYSLFSDTWVYSGGHWRELFPAVAPESIGGGGFVYDPTDHYMLLFGGQLGGDLVCNQTWTFVHGNWTELFPTLAPPARQFGGLTYDAQDGYVLLFGGNDNGYRWFADTWTFSAGVWTNRTGTTGAAPSARIPSYAYDATDHYVVLFGGTDAGNSYLSDTWTYSNGTWSQIYPAASPPGRWTAPMAYDPADGYVVLFGSIGLSNTGYLNDTWTFAHGSWTNVTKTVGPLPRWVSSMTYDGADQAVMLFGGYYQPNNLGDTWFFSGGNWSQWTAGGNGSPPYPANRANATMAFDPALSAVVLFGGAAPSGSLLSDTWTFSGTNWSSIPNAGVPPARSLASMTYDSHDHYLLLFGGLGPNGPLNDTWSFANGTWTNRTGAGTAPDPRSAAAMVDDPADGYVVLFGGAVHAPGQPIGDRNDTWTYANGQWTSLAPRPAPAPRHGVSAAFDAPDDYVLLFGGEGATANPPAYVQYGDTWSFHSGNWTYHPVAPAPSPRSEALLAYLPTSRSVVLYGGYVAQNGSQSTDTWSYAGGSWTQLAPASNPGSSAGASMAWDSNPGVLVLFGTYDGWPGAETTWGFSFGNSTNTSGYPAAHLNVVATAGPGVARAGEVQVAFWANVSGGTPPYTLQWTFGDGSEGSALPGNPTIHGYANPGIYSASLNIRDGEGDLRVVTLLVDVVAPTSTGAGIVGSGLGHSLAAAAPEWWLLAALALAAVDVAAAAAVVRARRRERSERAGQEGAELVRLLREPAADPSEPPGDR